MVARSAPHRRAAPPRRTERLCRSSTASMGSVLRRIHLHPTLAKEGITMGQFWAHAPRLEPPFGIGQRGRPPPRRLRPDRLREHRPARGCGPRDAATAPNGTAARSSSPSPRGAARSRPASGVEVAGVMAEAAQGLPGADVAAGAARLRAV